MLFVVLCVTLLFITLFTLWSCSCSSSRSRSHSPRYILPLLLTVISSVSWLFIRFGFGRIYTTFDEAYYLSTVRVGGVYSGFLTPLLLRGAYHMIHDPVLSLLSLSLIIFVLYPLFLMKFYGAMGVGNPTTVVLVLFMSSYYVWTANAVRPQQLGVLVGLIVLMLHVRSKPLKNWIITSTAWILLWISLLLIHILSFMVFFLLILLLSSVDVFLGRLDVKRAVIEVLAAVPAVVVLMKFPPYAETVYSIKWMLKHSSFSILRYAGWNFSWLFPLVFLSLSLLPVISGLLGRRLMLRRFVDKLVLAVRKRSSAVFWLLLTASAAGLYVQFQLDRSVYTSVYSGKWLLPIMQIGNIFFAVLLIYGLVRKAGRWGLFEKGSAIMLAVGAFGLLISMAMPGGYGSFGFRNWTIRVLQYLVFLGAPLVADTLRERLSAFVSRGHVVGIRAVTLLLITFTVISVLNVARPPAIYRYPYYWTPSDLGLVRNAGPGFVYESNFSPVPNPVALSFLGWAYGFRLVPVDGKLMQVPSAMCYGGLCYAPFPYNLTPMRSVGDRVRLITGRMPGDMKKLAASMLAIGGISADRNASTVLVLGNSSTNTLIKRLQSRYLLPVMVNFSVITGPTFVIYMPYTLEGEHVTCGWAYFVVQSVRINGSNVVVISGPNYDAVFAGLWWFVSGGRRSNFSYVVGVWRERDGKVLDPLRCGPGDRNGFSFGDEVRIRRAG